MGAYVVLQSTNLQVANNSAVDFGANTSWTWNFTNSSGATTNGSLGYSTSPSNVFQLSAVGSNVTLTLQGNQTTGFGENQPVIHITNGSTFNGTGANQTLIYSTVTFAPSSGNAILEGFNHVLTVNQSGTASGSYHGFRIQVVETSVLGTANKFFICQGGTSGTTTRFEINSSGQIDNYAGVATAGNGVPSEVADVNSSANSSAISSALLYAVPSAGPAAYRVSIYAKVTTDASTSSTLGGSSGFQISYTDSTDSTSQTITLVNQCNSNLSGNTTSTVFVGSAIIYAAGGTNISYSVGYTSSGSTPMEYLVKVRVESL